MDPEISKQKIDKNKTKSRKEKKGKRKLVETNIGDTQDNVSNVDDNLVEDVTKKKKRKKEKKEKKLSTDSSQLDKDVGINKESHRKKRTSKITSEEHVQKSTLQKPVIDASGSERDADDEPNHCEKKKKKKKKEKQQHADRGSGESKDDTSSVAAKPKKDKKKQTKDAESVDSSVDTSISAQTAATDYLKTWSNDKASWKFQKVRQVWLLQNLYDQSKVSASDFSILLLYLENLKGKAKDETLSKASKILEAGDSDGSSDEDGDRVTKCDRAREILQMLN